MTFADFALLYPTLVISSENFDSYKLSANNWSGIQAQCATPDPVLLARAQMYYVAYLAYEGMAQNAASGVTRWKVGDLEEAMANPSIYALEQRDKALGLAETWLFKACGRVFTMFAGVAR